MRKAPTLSVKIYHCFRSETAVVETLSSESISFVSAGFVLTHLVIQVIPFGKSSGSCQASFIVLKNSSSNKRSSCKVGSAAMLSRCFRNQALQKHQCRTAESVSSRNPYVGRTQAVARTRREYGRRYHESVDESSGLRTPLMATSAGSKTFS